MLPIVIPFEIHLTVELPNADALNGFLSFCELHHCKPLLIELAQGSHSQQPMLSQVYHSNNFEEVLGSVNYLSAQIQTEGYTVRRLKVEVPSENWSLFPKATHQFESYFEWHGKIPFTNPTRLEAICELHKAHLSLNALKNQHEFRFITLREYGNYVNFKRRIAELSEDLEKLDCLPLKQQSEYCIYDNNQILDTGWLPQ